MRTKRQGALPPVLSALLLLLPIFLYAEDEPALPRLAVVEFTVEKDVQQATKREAVNIREQVRSNIVENGRYVVIARAEIDKILSDQKIATSAISEDANLKKLRLLQIRYLVTGVVGETSGNYYRVVIDILDVTNGHFANSATGLISTNPLEQDSGIAALVKRFLDGMSSSGGQVGQRVTGNQGGGGPGPVPNGFVRIQGGTFTMGSPPSEVNRLDSEAQHRVTVSGFYMGQYEVTQAEYETIIGSNPSNFKGSSLPVENVSWFDAVFYCNQRSAREGLTPAYTINGENVTWNRNANGYRLPTEAEWEYACRANTTTPFSTGYNITTSQANYDGNYPYNNNAKGTYREKTTNVGSFASNSWGLYDMHGNVWEWCWDWYGGYNMADQTDPTGAASGSRRVLRGGSWIYYAQYLRSAFRSLDTPSFRSSYYGFRVVRP